MHVRRTSVLLSIVALVAAVLAVAGPTTASQAATAAPKAARTTSAARVAGQPPANYAIPATSFFSFLNKTRAQKLAIRNRVLRVINSTWGGPKTPSGLARSGNGTIRIATWTFKDMAVAHALVNARARGVSVQVVAAKAANKDAHAWHWLQKRFGSKLYKPGHPETRDLVSFARACRGSCRGSGGTAHAKYFLFSNVSTAHLPAVTISTSMNLTPMGYQGQWNQAEVSHDQTTYDQFLSVYRQSRIGRPVAAPYRVFNNGAVINMFFPMHGASPSSDPVMQMLNKTTCTGATDGGNANHRTRIRIINYSIYGDRGVWIAKKLRSLWNAGCDIKIIYSVSSRPVISILRNSSGRGRIPVRQCVIVNGKREIIKYNHSKWMTITGNWGGASDSFVTMSGSANDSLFAFTGDEQVQQIQSKTQALRHISIFNQTWVQGASHQPGFGIKGSEARMTEDARIALIPEEPTWHKGIYKFLGPDGD